MGHSDYKLVDIHIHSNLSYDAFENANGPTFDLDEYLTKLEDSIDMGVITDHNIFDYSRHKEIEKKISSSQLKILPGVEVNISDVHWIIILDDKDKNKLEKFSKELAIAFGYDVDNYNISDLKATATTSITPKKIIEILNEAKLDFIAIPHLEKHKGIWKESKRNLEISKEIIDLFQEGIIFGFESKRYEHFFTEKIRKTNEHILLHADIENISRKEHLEFLHDCVKKIGNSAIIYGSDFHCKKGDLLSDYDDYIKKLFYIKSDKSFRGIKFGLLDNYSRVFSLERKKKYSKRDDYQIDYISLRINNKKRDIYLGDGLNSIIGVKGSGKSFLVNLVIGETSKYKSGIQTQIKLEKIVFKNGEEFNSLDDSQYTAILQKSDNNLYDMLSDAPYNTGKLIDLVKGMFLGQGKEKRNDSLKTYISSVNKCIEYFLEKNKLLNNKVDFSYGNSYESYYLTKEYDSKFFTLIGNLKNAIENQISSKKKNVSGMKNLDKKFDDFVDGYNNLLDNDDFKKHVQDSKFNEKIDIFKQDYKELGETYIALQIKRIERVEYTQGYVTELYKDIYNSLGNQDRFFEQKNSSLRDFISNSFKILCHIEEATFTVRGLHDLGIVEDTTKYEIKQDDIDMVIIDKKELDFKELSKYVPNIIGNYNTNISIKYDSIFAEFNFGAFYLKNLLPYKDGRKTVGSLQGYGFNKPEIKTRIILKNSVGEYDLDKLSPGERSDLILDMVLSTKAYKILILDQPEDDLDNETVFNKIVTRIRELKLYRQIIMVTHNGNLCINSDSDIILVCEKNDTEYNIIHDSMESMTKHRYHNLNGDESDLTVLHVASRILEGGNKALGMRLKKIGYHELITGKEG